MLTLLLSIVGSGTLFSQPPQYLNVIQNMNFGTFFPTGSGGDINISPDGTRSATGGVVLFGGSQPTQAIFELITRGNRKPISFNISNAVLNRVGGGGSMNATIHPPVYNVNNIQNNTPFPINVGGTLHVGSVQDNPPGNYSGTFTFTLIFN